MSECPDKRFPHMLYAYEQGMLSDEERRELELHLLDCEHCFADLRGFREAAGLIKHDVDVRQSVHEFVAGESSPEIQTVGGERERFSLRRFWPRVVPAALVAAAALILLVLQPWEIEFRPTREAIAVGPRLAVMYFDNVTDQEDSQQLGEIAANLLITDLSESGYLQVISGQRLYDILKLLGREGQKRVDRDIARRVADTAGADVMLLGSILQTEPHFVLTAQLVDVATGRVLAAQRVTGEAGEDIFSLVDQLTAEIKAGLTLPDAAGTEPDRRVAEVTTHSPEAYRYYLQGIDLLNKYYRTEAAEYFTKAVDIDSTFAMAYYYLSELTDRSLIDQAVQYIDRSGTKEAYFIRSRQAGYSGDTDSAIAELNEVVKRYPDEKKAYHLLGQFYDGLGDYERAVEYFDRALSIDPLYQQAINYLAYVYNRMGEYEKAIAAINRYISLAPDEANPYDTRGEIYAKNGKADLAIESFRQALDIKPDFYNSRWNLGHLLVLTHQYAGADSAYRQLTRADDINTRSMARIYLPYIPLVQGKFAEAIRVIDENLAADSAEGLENIFPTNFACKFFVKSSVLMEQKKYDQAKKSLEKYMELYQVGYPAAVIYERDTYVGLLTEMGDLAAAEEVAESLKSALEQGESPMDAYWHAAGRIESAKGNPEAAIAHLTKISPGVMYYARRFALARAYQEAGHLAEAATEFEALTTDYSGSRAFWCILDVKLRYYLGQVYEESRWFSKAITQYELFLEFWKNADPGIPEIDDAKARLARLKASS